MADAILNRGVGARGIEKATYKLFEYAKMHIKEIKVISTKLTINPEMTYAQLKNLLPKDYQLNSIS